MYKLHLLALAICLNLAPLANACTPNENSPYTLTREKWDSIRQLMKNTSMTLDRESVTKSQISSKIRFTGNCSFKGKIENCIWLDKQDCKKKITAKFRDSELVTIRKSGF